MRYAIPSSRMLILATAFLFASVVFAQQAMTTPAGVAVGPQYDTTHVYIAPADFDAFVNSFTATFGGKPSKRIVAKSCQCRAAPRLQYMMTPVGALSIFAFQTPVPFPFGQERTGYLVADMDRAIMEARAAGAEVIVEPFKDPIGVDAVIQWPGGVKMQLYWHSRRPPIRPSKRFQTIASMCRKIRPTISYSCFVHFAHGKVVADDKHADAGEIGRQGETYRRIRIASLIRQYAGPGDRWPFPYPFGHETTGYQVRDLGSDAGKSERRRREDFVGSL